MQQTERASIGIVEDDAIMGESLLERLHLEGFAPIWWRSGEDALAGVARRCPDLVVCDIRLPGISGEDVVARLKPVLGRRPVLFMTGYGDIDQAVRLVRDGADDYVTKPFRMDDFLSRVRVLLRSRGSAGEGEPTGALGISAAMQRIEATLRRVAEIDATLLITGESGAGKEVAARFVHQISGRARQPFMAVNCAAIPEPLIESELFGHERGAFTGAGARHEGYAERARGGILFLDEIGDLPVGTQVKLLRLIEARAFHRIGGERELPFHARVIAATNVPLLDRVKQRQFREDLYYRLNVIPIEVPPLRSRIEDIGPLLEAFVEEYAGSFGAAIRGLGPDALAMARRYPWPGNVRELRNRVERAVALAVGPWIDAASLFPELGLAEAAGTEGRQLSLAEVRDEAERQHIGATLERTGGNVAEAAALLGVSRSTLFERIKKLGLGRRLHEAGASRFPDERGSRVRLSGLASPSASQQSEAAQAVAAAGGRHDTCATSLSPGSGAWGGTHVQEMR